MREFLIKTRSGNWFSFPKGSDPFRPITIPFRAIDGWGDARIEIEGCEISFSYEDPGIQVTFEGEIDEDRALQIMRELVARAQEISGKEAYLIQL